MFVLKIKITYQRVPYYFRLLLRYLIHIKLLHHILEFADAYYDTEINEKSIKDIIKSEFLLTNFLKSQKTVKKQVVTKSSQTKKISRKQAKLMKFRGYIANFL